MRFWGVAFLVCVVLGNMLPNPLGWLFLAMTSFAALICLVHWLTTGAETIDRATAPAPRIPLQRQAVD